MAANLSVNLFEVVPVTLLNSHNNLTQAVFESEQSKEANLAKQRHRKAQKRAHLSETKKTKVQKCTPSSGINQPGPECSASIAPGITQPCPQCPASVAPSTETKQKSHGQTDQQKQTNAKQGVNVAIQSYPTANSCCSITSQVAKSRYLATFDAKKTCHIMGTRQHQQISQIT